MALPEVLDPTIPADTETLSLGASRIRNLTQAVVDILGLPTAPTAVSAAAFTTSATGVVTIRQPGATVAADPTVPLGIATKQYVDAGQFGVTTIASGVNTYAATVTPTQATGILANNHPFAIGFAQSSTGACTLSLNGGAAYPIYFPNGIAMASGDIIGGQWMTLLFQNSLFRAVDANFMKMTGGYFTGAIVATAVSSQYGPNQLTGSTYMNEVAVNDLTTTGNLSVGGTAWIGTISTSQPIYGGGGASFGGTVNLQTLGVYNYLWTNTGVPIYANGPIDCAQPINLPGAEPGGYWQAIPKGYFDARIPQVAQSVLASPAGPLSPNIWYPLLAIYFNITPPFTALAYAYVFGSIAAVISSVSGTPTVSYCINEPGGTVFQSAATSVTANGTIQTPAIVYVQQVGGATTYFELFVSWSNSGGNMAITIGGPTFLEGFILGH